MFLVKHLSSWLNYRPQIFLIAAAFVFAAFFGAAVLIKYNFFLYNGLDLAIFNNSLWNLIHGNNLYNAIHPPTYWADHVSPWLLVLALPYALWADPQFLLLSQIVVLAACVWPLYLIARKYLSPRLACLVAGLWLVNPLIHNISLYEFSLVPWSIFFLLWAYYWYDQKHWARFIIFSLLAITTREDVAVMLVGFSILAAIDKCSWKWWLTPGIIGLGWFAVTQYIINQASLIGVSKFVNYYSWLWQPSLAEISRHFLNLGNVQIFLGLLLPLLFLPLLRPKTLILTLLPLGILRLASGDDGAAVLRAHYGGFLLWPLFIATILALATDNQPRLLQKLTNYRLLIILSLLTASIYASLTYGNILPLVNYHWNSSRAEEYRLAWQQIPETARVASTYSFLTPLSSRQQLQLLPYAYAGMGQFALTNYQLDPQTEYLLIDWQEWLIAQVHYPGRYPQKVSLADMTTCWQSWQADYRPIWQQGAITIFQRHPNNILIATVKPTSNQAATLNIFSSAGQSEAYLTSPATTSLQALQLSTANSTYYLPLAYGLWTSTSSSAEITMPLNDPAVKKIDLVAFRWPQIMLNNINTLELRWKSLITEATADVNDK
ncbi:MAG: DUF2079 domain-containing protein [Candidatus Komeilibacteria bacterium]